MAELAGQFTLEVDGEELLTIGKIKFNMGGTERTQVMKSNGKPAGFSEQGVGGMISGQFALGQGVKIRRLNQKGKVTVILKIDSAHSLMCANAALTSPLEGDVGEGESSVAFEYRGDELEEL